jgi:hypothetical protein
VLPGLSTMLIGSSLLITAMGNLPEDWYKLSSGNFTKRNGSISLHRLLFYVGGEKLSF